MSINSPLGPPAEPLDMRTALQGNIRRLHHIQRYSSLPVIKPENVATHSWQVSFIALLIGTDINEVRANAVPALPNTDEPPVNMEDLLRRAILHDINETMSGDIIRSYKYGHSRVREAMEEADHMNTYRLTRQFGHAVGDEFMTTWQYAKDDTLEGEIVALADVLAVVTYCAEEARLGSSEMNHVAQHAYNNILRPRWLDGTNFSQWLAPYIEQMYPHGDWRDIYENPDRIRIEEQ